jgi:tyrosyl-tRNA synthetase
MGSPVNDVFDGFPTLRRCAADVIAASELRSKLTAGRPMRIKYGVDVTAPFLHIGHAVNLWAMRELQEVGHKVVLLIGDFTTRIGDPTGRTASRSVIPPEQIDADADAFIAQAGQVLLTGPEVLEIRRKSQWWVPMPLEKFLGHPARTAPPLPAGRVRERAAPADRDGQRQAGRNPAAHRPGRTAPRVVG